MTIFFFCGCGTLWVLIVSFCLRDAGFSVEAGWLVVGPCESAHLIQLLYSSGILKAIHRSMN